MKSGNSPGGDLEAGGALGEARQSLENVRAHYTLPSSLILPRLNRVISRGPGQWSASCPTGNHPKGDRSRGLSIRETSEGKLLLHCFSGCDVASIVGALGLELHDLFPRSQADDRGDCGRLRAKPRVSLHAAYEALEARLWACSLAFSDLARGVPFSPVDAAFIAATAAELASILAEVRHAGI